MNVISKGVLLVAAGMIGLAGCATPRSPELEEAQRSYSAVQEDPVVSKDASVILYEAKQALDQAEQSDSMEAQKHYAYLAQKKIELARTQSDDEQSAKAVADLKERQESFLMALHKRQAEEAGMAARQAKQELQAYQSQAKAAELEEAQQQAQQAQSELERLQKELADMQSRSTDAGVVLTLRDVVFEYDKAQLKAGAERGLERISDFLLKHPERQVVVEGFTDSRGSEPYNQRLSERRAEAVAQALAADGVSSERITTRGHGENYPVATNDTDVGRQQNRRVEITILNEDRQARDAGRGKNPV